MSIHYKCACFSRTSTSCFCKNLLFARTCCRIV